MKNYKKPDSTLWTGRVSDTNLYMHEMVSCIDMNNEHIPPGMTKAFAILGYACDEGIRRNQGRIGASKGPSRIRKKLASLSNHFDHNVTITDFGNITCNQKNLEHTQVTASKKITQLLQQNYFPIVLGGGHDLAYSHFNGIKSCYPDKKIGIINLDAHLDLRKPNTQGNSGTPFYQLAIEYSDLSYLCLGIQKESNHKDLYQTARDHNIQFLHRTEFTIENKKAVMSMIEDFISEVEHIYLTIDLDGFSSSLAPGVSAPSPMGFSLDIALQTIQYICDTKKLLSLDIVELNPVYDIDDCTAALAARLVWYCMDLLCK